MRIKLSPSLLNTFSRYVNPSIEYEDFDRLMAHLVAPFETTQKMAFGTACHKFIENPEEHHYIDGKGYRIQNDSREAEKFGSHTFISIEEAEPLIKFHQEHPFGVYEQRHHKTYKVPGYEVVLSCKIDMIEGAKVHDFKITESKVEAQEYMDSYQWRCYLDVTELPEFEYNIWQRRGRHPEKELVEFPIKLYAYDGMHEDLLDMMSRFIHFLEHQNLIKNYAY